MIGNNELERYLNQFLCVDQFVDYAPNGLQIAGCQTIKRIITAVTASLDAIEYAVEKQAHALLVHHGYFWKGEDSILTHIKRQRIATLLANNINLYGYHLPLDCHDAIGNNACLHRLLNINQPKGHTINRVPNLLWTGQLDIPHSPADFAHLLSITLQRDPLVIVGSNKPIKKVAWCSGAAQDFLKDAYEMGVDAYISGEVSERTYYEAKEFGIHYFGAGHHATECYGIQKLGEKLADEFDLMHEFYNSHNPI